MPFTRRLPPLLIDMLFPLTRLSVAPLGTVTVSPEPMLKLAPIVIVPAVQVNPVGKVTGLLYSCKSPPDTFIVPVLVMPQEKVIVPPFILIVAPAKFSNPPKLLALEIVPLLVSVLPAKFRQKKPIPMVPLLVKVPKFENTGILRLAPL